MEEKTSVASELNRIAPQPGAGAARERLVELDALRGIAACVVMALHFIGVDEAAIVPAPLREFPGSALFYPFRAGQESVMLFFMLSGLVLALPYVRGVRQPWAAFVLKRIFRIYVPYLAALALAVWGAWNFHGLVISDWFSRTWPGPPTWGQIADHVLFIGYYPPATFNTAFWSLPHEMRISLVFPFLCLLCLRLPTAAVVAAAFLLPFADTALHAARIIPDDYLFRFSGLFVAGIVLARHRVALTRWVDGLRAGPAALLVAAALAFYYAGHFLNLLPHIPNVDAMGIGAFGIILFAMGENGFSRFLRGAVPQFLGHISYALYLLHGTVLFLLVYLLHGRLPLGWLLVPFFALSIGAATVFYRVVEIPAMDAGRRLARRFFKSA